MARRSKVRRFSDGTPYPEWRCQAEVVDKTELFPRQCLKVRLRGVAYCDIHSRVYRLKLSDSRLEELVPSVVSSLSRISEHAFRYGSRYGGSL